jgi:hypothetical protein
LYRADDRSRLDAILASLPLYEWMHLRVTPLDPHPNDPAASVLQAADLPVPRLMQVYRLEATLSTPMDLGDVTQGRRRIVALTGGTFTGPEIKGTLLPGASADWQIALADGTALGDIRYTLQTDDGDLLYVQSSSTRYGDLEVLARLGRGETVDPSEYVFRAATPDRDRGTASGLDEQERLRHRRRSPAVRRRLRNLPRPVTPCCVRSGCRSFRRRLPWVRPLARSRPPSATRAPRPSRPQVRGSRPA